MTVIEFVGTGLALLFSAALTGIVTPLPPLQARVLVNFDYLDPGKGRGDWCVGLDRTVLGRGYTGVPVKGSMYAPTVTLLLHVIL